MRPTVVKRHFCSGALGFTPRLGIPPVWASTPALHGCNCSGEVVIAILCVLPGALGWTPSFPGGLLCWHAGLDGTTLSVRGSPRLRISAQARGPRAPPPHHPRPALPPSLSGRAFGERWCPSTCPSCSLCLFLQEPGKAVRFECGNARIWSQCPGLLGHLLTPPLEVKSSSSYACTLRHHLTEGGQLRSGLPISRP